MADYRRHYDEEPRRPERDLSARSTDETRGWFGDGSPTREDHVASAIGGYRTDTRGYHDRFRAERPFEGPSLGDGNAGIPASTAPPWARRERGGYWRTYEPQGSYAGRGPKDYQRSDDRVREEVCDCMTDDPMLDASEITVVVVKGEVILSGTVTSRDQKRRAEDVADRISGVKDVTNQLRVSREANGHNHTAAPPVTQPSGKGIPSKSSSTTT